MVTKRIACFLTCDYTESGAMQAFLKKINSNYEYNSTFPTKQLRKKAIQKQYHPK